MANERGSVAKGRGAEETTAHIGRIRESGGAAKRALMKVGPASEIEMGAANTLPLCKTGRFQSADDMVSGRRAPS